MPYFDIGQPSMMSYETFLYNNPKNVLTKKFTDKPNIIEPSNLERIKNYTLN